MLTYGLCISGLEPMQSQIGSAIGMWRTLPNAKPRLEVPLKVGRKGFASEGVNVIPGIDRHGTSVLHYSSGHGSIDMDSSRVEAQTLEELTRCVDEIAVSLFPDQYAQAWAAGALDELPCYCVRPG